MLKRLVLGLAASLGVAASPAFAATNLVSNGSFELGADPGSFTTLGTGSTAITDWLVSAGSVDYIGSYWTAQDGVRSVDLAGLALGTLQQTVATEAGKYYTLFFYSSKNPDLSTPTRTGTVSFGGSSQTFSYAAANSLTSMNWVLNQYSFQATGTSTLLSFAANADAGCCWGPALDNVSLIAAVPEPEAWAMLLLGFGAVGFQMRRRGGLKTVTA